MDHQVPRVCEVHQELPELQVNAVPPEAWDTPAGRVRLAHRVYLAHLDHLASKGCLVHPVGRARRET